MARTAQLKPDVIVIGINTLDNETLDKLLILKNTCPTTVVIFADHESPETITQSVKSGVNAYVIDDIKPHRISGIITMGYARFIESQRLEAELTKTKLELSNRKVIECAKGILMRQKSLSENQAFQIMRNMSMNKGISIARVATNIIDVFDLIEA